MQCSPPYESLSYATEAKVVCANQSSWTHSCTPACPFWVQPVQNALVSHFEQRFVPRMEWFKLLRSTGQWEMTEAVPGCLPPPLLPQEATGMPGEVWAGVTLVWYVTSHRCPVVFHALLRQISGIWIKASWCGSNSDKLELLASTGMHWDKYPNATSVPYSTSSQITIDHQTWSFPLFQD